jgi:acetolactate decarboxylase
MRRSSLIFVLAIVVFVLSGVLHAQPADHSVFQVSTYQALKQGVFDNETTFSELRKHGDFGLGTLNGLDGEMVALNSEFFQIKADGSVHSIPDDAQTPFAVVTFFKHDKKVFFTRINNLKYFQDALDQIESDRDSILAIRVSAVFAHIKVRSPHRQTKPYPRLEEALKGQAEFELKNVEGTLVGFRFPKYMDGVSVPGDHLHFISTDKKAGGHVMDFSAEDAEVEIATVSSLSLKLPK